MSNQIHFLFLRFHTRRNYLANSDSYGDSLLENCDDLEYPHSSNFDDETPDICEECQQSDFLHEIPSIVQDSTDMKNNFRGCRRNRHMINNSKHGQKQVDDELNIENIKFYDNTPAKRAKSTSSQYIKTSVSRTEKYLGNSWRKLKKEFSSKLIDIPDDVTKGARDVDAITHKTSSDTFTNRLNGNNCNCNDLKMNNYCSSHNCQLRSRELPKFSNVTERSDSRKNDCHHEPILAPIRDVLSHINE